MTAEMRSDKTRVEAATQLAEATIKAMGIDGSVEADETGDPFLFDIKGEGLDVLTKNKGRALNALQCLINVALNKPGEDWKRAVLDADGYRDRRRQELEDAAVSAADRAVEIDERVGLEPMNAYERRIVHCALAGRDDIETHSEGEEPNRRIIVAPAS